MRRLNKAVEIVQGKQIAQGINCKDIEISCPHQTVDEILLSDCKPAETVHDQKRDQHNQESEISTIAFRS